MNCCFPQVHGVKEYMVKRARARYAENLLYNLLNLFCYFLSRLLDARARGLLDARA